MLKTCFYKESILVEGWEDCTTKQIAVALEEFIKERQKKGFNVAEIVCGGAKIILVLADGSEVLLNAESKLTFPVVFREKERRVYLEGEAYFQVKKNHH